MSLEVLTVFFFIFVAERRKVEPVKKENVSDAKKRKTNRFDE